MRIAICDDEINALTQTMQIVAKVMDETELKYSIDQFTNADELLADIMPYELVFLDIELKGQNKNGVVCAKEIKRKNPDCLIIFVTNYEEYIDEVIGSYAFRYWSKPIDEYRLRKSLTAVIERSKTLTFENYITKETAKLPLYKVLYITPVNKRCEIVTTEGKYVASESFKAIKEKISMKNFCECHGSYCINLNFVEGFDRLKVYLGDGENQYEVHLSRRQYRLFKDQLFIVGGERV